MITCGGRISSMDYNGTNAEKMLLKDLLMTMNESGYMVGNELKEYVYDCYNITRPRESDRKNGKINVDTVLKWLELNVYELREYRKRTKGVRKNKKKVGN